MPPDDTRTQAARRAEVDLRTLTAEFLAEEDRLREGGGDEAIARQHARFLREGAIGSHLENLQRHEGYKGFNQQAVSAIIAATDPRLH